MAEAPNMIHVVADVAARFPVEFANCHRVDSGGRQWDFVKRLTWELYKKYDQRWGLNGKRGTDVLSMDAIAFRVGPTDRHAEVIDVVGGAGAPGAKPTWNNVTNYDPRSFGQPDTARWIQPSDPGGGAVQPPASVPMAPEHLSVVHQFVAARGLPAIDEATMRAWTADLCAQMAYSFPGAGFGHKRAGQGRPPSTNILAQQADGHLYGYAVLTETGAYQPSPDRWDLSGQIFIPVEPRNFLPVSPPVAPPPVDPPVVDPPPVQPPAEPPPVTGCQLTDAPAILAQLQATQVACETLHHDLVAILADPPEAEARIFGQTITFRIKPRQL